MPGKIFIAEINYFSKCAAIYLGSLSKGDRR